MMRFKVRWDRIAATFALGAVFGIMLCWAVVILFG
jgi:hypothetical protein